MLSKFIASVVLVIGIAAPALAQAGPVYNQIPAGYTLRPDSPSGESGPVYDERGFYAGYFKVARRNVAEPYTPRQEEEPAPPAQDEFSGEAGAGYSGYGGYYGYGYPRPVTVQLSNIGTSTYTGIAGYSPTLPFFKSGQGGSSNSPNVNHGSQRVSSTSVSTFSAPTPHSVSTSSSSSSSSSSSGSSHTSGSGSSGHR
jgi:hypothetical protein